MVDEIPMVEIYSEPTGPVERLLQIEKELKSFEGMCITESTTYAYHMLIEEAKTIYERYKYDYDLPIIEVTLYNFLDH